MTEAITVIKRNAAGKEVWLYNGIILKRDASQIVLEARFQSPDVLFMGALLRQGDRFVETYFTDRWYNIFEIHDRENDRLKGWYCNIARPAVWEAEDRLSYEDLALDLWVDPDGKQTVLDEDEFAELELDPQTQAQARRALAELKKQFSAELKPDL